MLFPNTHRHIYQIISEDFVFYLKVIYTHYKVYSTGVKCGRICDIDVKIIAYYSVCLNPLGVSLQMAAYPITMLTNLRPIYISRCGTWTDSCLVSSWLFTEPEVSTNEEKREREREKKKREKEKEILLATYSLFFLLFIYLFCLYLFVFVFFLYMRIHSRMHNKIHNLGY